MKKFFIFILLSGSVFAGKKTSKGTEVQTALAKYRGNPTAMILAMGPAGNRFKSRVRYNKRKLQQAQGAKPVVVLRSVMAGDRSQLALLKLLFDARKLDPTMDGTFRGPLFNTAAQAGNVPLMELLLEYDEVDIDGLGRWSQTPLMDAAHAGKTEVAEFLLERGADPTIKVPVNFDTSVVVDTAGYTAAAFASENYHRELAERLQRAEQEWVPEEDDPDTAMIRAGIRAKLAAMEQ